MSTENLTDQTKKYSLEEIRHALRMEIFGKDNFTDADESLKDKYYTLSGMLGSAVQDHLEKKITPKSERDAVIDKIKSGASFEDCLALFSETEDARKFREAGINSIRDVFAGIYFLVKEFA